MPRHCLHCSIEYLRVELRARDYRPDQPPIMVHKPQVFSLKQTPFSTLAMDVLRLGNRRFWMVLDLSQTCVQWPPSSINPALNGASLDTAILILNSIRKIGTSNFGTTLRITSRQTFPLTKVYMRILPSQCQIIITEWVVERWPKPVRRLIDNVTVLLLQNFRRPDTGSNTISCYVHWRLEQLE